jgi:hypothetical protein
MFRLRTDLYTGLRHAMIAALRQILRIEMCKRRIEQIGYMAVIFVQRHAKK